MVSKEFEGEEAVSGHTTRISKEMLERDECVHKNTDSYIDDVIVREEGINCGRSSCTFMSVWVGIKTT